MNKILVTGSNGQLGSEIKNHFKDFESNFFYTDKAELDILNFKLVEAFVINNKINIILNCAAYTEVDLAETNKNLAYKVNYEAVKNFVDICIRHSCKLIQISTDFVFNKGYDSPINEEQKTSPISVYAKSKEKAEKLILNSNIDCVIIRTSWLYSKFGNNFVKTIIRVANEKQSINVVNNQLGSPTYAKDLAKVCIIFLKTEALNIKGINLYHFTNKGVCSWYDFAKEIVFLLKIKCNVSAVLSNEYKTLAIRPSYSKLDTSKIEKKLKININHWKESLNNCLIEL